MYRVILESPYGNDDPSIVARNIRYARACLRDALLHGQSALASHLLYTQPGVLDDKIPEERKLGINAGHAWMEFADAVVVYENLGLTPGMEQGVKEAFKLSRPVIFNGLSRRVMRGIQMA